MKKLTVILLLVLLVSVFVVPTAFASSNEYIEIKKDDVVFYSTYHDPLFLVPENCYVKVTGVSGDYISVEYHNVKGLILDGDYTRTSQGTGFYHTAQNAVVSSQTFLYSKPQLGSVSTAILESGSKLFPIGKYTSENVNYVYVSYTPEGGTTQYGAVLASAISWDGILTPPTNTSTPSTTPSTSGSMDTGAGNTNTNSNLNPEAKDPENNLVRVLLIIGICVPALIIVYLIFKPVKPSSNRYASDNPRRRDDYEDFE